jgi:uncharacterized protein involved in exopolysaccharide biosynthesis
MDRKDMTVPQYPVPRPGRQLAPQAMAQSAAMSAAQLVRRAPSMQQAPQALGMRDLLNIVFKYKYKIIAAFMLALVLTPLVYFMIPRVYEANSFLMVKFGWEYMYSPELAVQGQSPSPFARNEVINSEIQILNSRDLKERVISILGVKKIYPSLAQTGDKDNRVSDLAILEFEKNLTVKPIANSSVIEISFKGKDPQTVTEVLNQLLYFYSVKRLEIFKDPKSILFLEKKVAEYRQSLKDAEDRLESYKQESQVYSLPEQRSLLLNQRMSLDSTLMAAENRTRELQNRLISLEAQIKQVPSSTPGMGPMLSGVGGSPQSQLLALKLKEQELLGKYKEDNRLVVDVRKQIELVQQSMKDPKYSADAGFSGPANAVHQEVQKDIIKTKAELSSLDVSIGLLKKQLEDANKDIQSLEMREKKLRDLNRELSNYEKNYQLGQSKLEEARVFDDMDRQKMTSVSVVQPATVPIKPIRPNRGFFFFMAVGAVLGLGGGFGLAYLLEMLTPGLTSPQNAERRLRLPVLATIPLKEPAR